MKMTVLACPSHGALEAETLRLMKNGDRAVVIVPDQSSFSEEERLISAFGVVGLDNPEVLSFKRLYYKLSAGRPSGKKRLTPAAREMAVMHSLSAIAPEDFRLFRGVIKKRELAPAVSALITGFKRYGVTAEKLRACDGGLPEGLPLRRKIHDCLKALESYDSFMEGSGLKDADDDMTELAAILGREDCRFFDGRQVFITRFSDLNRVQLDCVSAICRRAESVVAAVVWDDKPEFATAKKLIHSLREAAENAGGSFELRTPEYTDPRPEPLAYLSANYYGGARLVKGGRRYRDITVAVRNMEDYAPYIRRIFPIYSIPVFADETRPLSGHSASRFVLSALELAVRGFTHENVFNFAKNPFAPHGGRCAELEDYCVEAGVRSWSWGGDFTFRRGSYSSLDYNGKTEPEDLEPINARRRELWELIEPLQTCLAKPRPASEYARALYAFMLAAELPEKAEAAAKLQENNGDGRGAEETRQAYDLLTDILDDVCTVFGDSVMDGGDFLEAVRTACAAVRVGAVPPLADSVVYGDIERMKGGRDRCVFVLGLNEDVFPRTFANNSIFSEYEAETLRDDWDILLPPGTSEKTENEKLVVYDALSFAEERLYLSYAVSTPDGRSLRPGPIVRRVKELFPKLRETEDISPIHGEYLCATKEAAFLELGSALSEGRPGRFWEVVRSLLASDPEYGPRLKRLERDRSRGFVDAENLDPELLKRAAGEELALSPSRLESYGGCPYSYFMQYILGLRDRTPMNINFADSGNMLHNIIDGFCSRVERDLGGDWTRADDAFTDGAFRSVCGEVRRGISRGIAEDPRLMTAVRRIEASARKCIDEIRRQVAEELFVPVGAEVIIGDDGSIPPTVIELPYGGRAKFTGRIDRTDIRRVKVTDGDGSERTEELVRVIDYKSGKKTLELGSVLSGLQLQLFAYMDSITSARPDALPAGVLYFTLVPELGKVDADGKTDLSKCRRVSGIAVEGRMEDSKDVPAVTPEEMRTVLNFVRRSVRSTAERISRGEVPIAPAKRGSWINCAYCPGAGVCRFDPRTDGKKARPVNELGVAEAIEKMREELTE